jgi:hypothetical protein
VGRSRGGCKFLSRLKFFFGLRFVDVWEKVYIVFLGGGFLIPELHPLITRPAMLIPHG